VLNKIVNTFGTRVAIAIINLLIAVMVSQVLGTEGKGVQSLVIVSITYILVFANLMGGGALVYLTPRFHFQTLAVPAYLWATANSLVFYFVIKWFDLVPAPMIVHVVLLAAINGFLTVNASILIGKEKIKQSNYIMLLQVVISALSLVMFFYVAGLATIQSYIITLYIAFGGAFGLSIILLHRHAENLYAASWKAYLAASRQMLHFGLLNQLAHIAQLLSFRMSYYWLNNLYGEAEVGIYSNGTSLVESIWLVSRSISMVQYAHIANSTDKVASQKLTAQLTLAAIAISALLLLVMIVLPSSFFVWLFGPGFGQVGAVILSLAPGVLMFNVALIVGHYFSGTGKYHVNTIASFAGLVVAIALYSLMIPALGITGAGWATSISYSFTSLIVLMFFAREMLIRPGDFIPRKGEMKIMWEQIMHWTGIK
jgi:O-antigen/teichoic acid export membrane protein